MTRSATVALVIQAVLTQSAWVGVRLMIGYRALAEGADAPLLGILAASFAAPGAVMALPAGKLSDRFGGPVIIIAGICAAGAGVGSLLVGQGMWLLPPAAAAIGLGHLMIMVGQQSFVAHRVTGGARDGAFGTLTAASSTGQLLGPVIATTVAAIYADGNNPHGVDADAGIAATGVLTLCALPVTVWLLTRGGRRRAGTRSRPARSSTALLRDAGVRRSMVVSAAVLVTIDLVYAFTPVWAVSQGVSATTVGWLLALRAAVSVVSRVGLSRLVERFGRVFLMRFSIASGAAALAVLPFVGAPGAVPVMVLLGIALGVPQPLTMSWIVSLVPSESYGQVLGLRMAANRLAQIALPPLVGAVAGPMGVAGIFFANSVFLSAALLAVRAGDAGPDQRRQKS